MKKQWNYSRLQFVFCHFILLIIPAFSNAQITFQKVGSIDDYGISIINTTDNGFAVCGITSIGAGNRDLYVIKFDSSGNIQWTRAVGGSDNDEGNAMVQTFDGGYAITGFTESFGAGEADVYVVKLDSNGNLLWTKTIGGSDDDRGYSIIQMTDTGLTIAGYYGSVTDDMYLIRLDQFGNLQWTKKINAWGVGYSIVENSGSGYLMCGGSNDYGGSVFIARLNDAGDVLNAEYITGSDDQYARSITKTYDGGHCVVGYTYAFGPQDVYVVKLDINDQIQWTEKIGGNLNDEAYSSISTTDSGIAIVGATNSFSLNGYLDVYVIKLNKNGSIQWTRTFGWCNHDVGRSIVETPDKGYAICGYGSYSTFSFQLYLLKIDSNGNTCGNFGTGGSIIGSGGTTIPGGISLPVISVLGTGGVSSSGGIIMDACSQVPSAIISSSSSNLCQSGCVDFWQQMLNCPISFTWFFPGATPSSSTDQNPTNICYNTTGTYDVSLITSNAYGSDTLTLINYITVYQAPPPPMITQNNDTLTSSLAFAYQWFMNGNLVAGATSEQFIITQPGHYSVVITDTLGCSASDSITAVLLLPQSDFTSNANSGCPNSCFDFTNASLNALSYEWVFSGGDPATSSQQNPGNICYANPGMYDVTLIASSNFASDTLTLAGYINIFTPVVVSVLQTGNFVTCIPAANSYQWFLNGNLIPDSISQTVFISETGTYTVEVIDSNGCASSATIIVTSLPSPGFLVSDTLLCEKFCINFLDQSTNNPNSWQWIFPGADPSLSTDQNPINICYNSPGNFDVTLITTNAAGNDTLTLPHFITVNPTPPFPTITQTGYTLTSSAATSYQWQFNSVDIPGATNQSYDVQQSGFYMVFITDQNGCVSSTTTYVVIAGLEDLHADENILIYPNPSNGNFMVELLNAQMADVLKIKVYNTVGQVVFSSEEKIVSIHFKKEIDLRKDGESYITPGIYFIEITVGSNFVNRIIILSE